RARRYGRPLSLVLLDLDHFRALNDRLGRIAGDQTLRAVAAVAGPLVRKDELLARYGGEEFAAVLPETDAGPAALCGERLRRAVEQRPFEWEGQRYAVTVSVGVGAAGGRGEAFTAAALIDREDKHRGEAKG